MQARYYDPVVGRFMAVDPMQFSGASPEYFGRYSYAANNPMNASDPNGREVVYNFKNGATYKDGILTIGYLAMSPTARGELAQIAASNQKYTISFDRSATYHSYDPETRTVVTNPELGQRVASSGEVQAPALLTGHEVSHAAQHDRVGTEAYVNSLVPEMKTKVTAIGVEMIVTAASREEARATATEGKIASELGQPARNDYGDESGGVTTCGPVSSSECQ
jgi:hypothetical protein